MCQESLISGPTWDHFSDFQKSWILDAGPAVRVPPAVTWLTVYRWLHIPVSNPLPQTPVYTFLVVGHAFLGVRVTPSGNMVDGLPLVAHTGVEP